VRRIFARISPNLPEKLLGHSLCKYFLPHRSRTPSFGMTCTKRLHMILQTLRAIFFSNQITLGAILCKGFNIFFPDLQGFCPDFHQFKTIGGALEPPASPPPIPPSRGAQPFRESCQIFFVAYDQNLKKSGQNGCFLKNLWPKVQNSSTMAIYIL